MYAWHRCWMTLCFPNIDATTARVRKKRPATAMLFLSAGALGLRKWCRVELPCRLDVKGSILWLQQMLLCLACQCLPILAWMGQRKAFTLKTLGWDSEYPGSDSDIAFPRILCNWPCFSVSFTSSPRWDFLHPPQDPCASEVAENTQLLCW